MNEHSPENIDHVMMTGHLFTADVEGTTVNYVTPAI